MSLTEPSARRHTPVRLTDIPLEKRYAAALIVAKHCDPDEAQDLFAAALLPSSTVYYVTADAIEQVAA